MTMQDNQGIFLEQLCKKWHMDADRILELAITGKVALWSAFFNVFLQKAATAGGAKKKKKTPLPEFHPQVVLQPLPELLVQLQHRTDRMLIAAELSCLDEQGKAVTVTNSVGEEWGETSMIGLNPGKLFARRADVARFEQQNKMVPQPGIADDDQEQPGLAPGLALSLNSKGHPCFAQELHVAVECWQAFFAPASGESPPTRKADLLAWIRESYPHLSSAAVERIALVASPSKKGATSR